MWLSGDTKNIFRSACNASFESVHCVARLNDDVGDTLPYLKGTLMIKLKWFALIETLLLCYVVTVFADDLKTADIPPVPTPGMVTMVDLGAHKCIPCKMMAPIIAELQTEYSGRASIIFIDVWEHREQAQRFGIRGIPTQIFFDKQGNEIKRHVGFLDKKSIVAVFDELGVPMEKGN